MYRLKQILNFFPNLWLFSNLLHHIVYYGTHLLFINSIPHHPHSSFFKKILGLQRSLLLMVFYQLSLAGGDITNEILLKTCQLNGQTLYASCVLKPPTSAEELSACTTLKSSYLICLQSLNGNMPLIRSILPDPYLPNPFSPCAFETGHMIMWTLCPN